MATTTNYGWTTPDDTALVKDGAAAIRTLGSSVDTTTKNLNPETTLGDIAYRSSTANVNTRLALGTANQQLRVNSGATAPEWFTPAASGGMTLLSTTTFDNTVTTYTVSSIAQTYKHLLVVGNGLQTSNASTDTVYFRFNGDTGSNYSFACSQVANGASQAHSTLNGDKLFGGTNTIANMALTGDASSRFGNFVLDIYDYTATSYKSLNYIGGSHSDGNGWNSPARGLWNNTAAITSITLASNVAANLKAGTVRIYGVS
jgi:hypothetical protein